MAAFSYFVVTISSAHLFLFTKLISPSRGQTYINDVCPGGDGGIELVPDRVYGCYGQYNGGPAGGGSLSLCGEGFAVCESANYAEVLGLGPTDCADNVPAGHFFWALEAGYVDDPAGRCASEWQNSRYMERPVNDVWGCTGDISNLPCGPNKNTACGVLNSNCGASEAADWTDTGMWLHPVDNGREETFILTVTDATKGGSLCCSETIPALPEDTCPNGNEFVTVFSVRRGNEVILPNYLSAVGFYTEMSGWPPKFKTVRPPWDVNFEPEIGVVVSPLVPGNELVVALTLGNDPEDIYYGAPGFVSFEENYKYTIQGGYFNEEGMETLRTVENSMPEELIQLYNINGENLQMVAQLNNCPNFGWFLDTSNPTASPSLKPTIMPSEYSNCPVEGLEFCETRGCAGQDSNGIDENPNCFDQKSWGCKTCNDGYFREKGKIPCVKCSDIAGCLRCANNGGCQECDESRGFVNPPVFDDDCNFKTCDNIRSECPIDVEIEQCVSPGCDQGREDENCLVYGTGSQNKCQECKPGYFFENKEVPCIACDDIPNCLECRNNRGCMLCEDGYEPRWNGKCKFRICRQVS